MRLTYRDSTVPHTNAKGELWEAYSDADYNEVINKLAAYEDTEFEPEEIDFCLGGPISPQEAKERYEAHKKRYDEWFTWKQAEEQGRLVTLPCKVGDTVYRICPKCNTSHDGSCANCAWQGTGGIGGCTVFGLWGDGSYPKERCTIVPWKASWNNMGIIIQYLNIRIFLTREEAEAKLKNY